MPPRGGISGLALLSTMITPAVLISACGTLIFSTSSRLARIVDRARSLTRMLEDYSRVPPTDFPAERRDQLQRQIGVQAQRVGLIQRALATLYLSLGIFVATTISIALTSWIGFADTLPGALGVLGTLVLFFACVLLIREARLALRGVREEMEFAVRLRDLYGALEVTRGARGGERR
jgi:hypothetical protein